MKIADRAESPSRTRIHSEQGLTLTSLLVSSALIGLLIMFATAALKQQFKVQGAISTRMDTIDLRRSLSLNVDCAKTMSAYQAQCIHPEDCDHSPLYVAVLDRGSPANTLIQIPGSHYTVVSGKYSLRASRVPCALCSSGFSLRIEVTDNYDASETSSGWRDLYDGIPSCNL